MSDSTFHVKKYFLTGKEFSDRKVLGLRVLVKEFGLLILSLYYYTFYPF